MAGKNYSHQLDAKNRMRIPAKIREQLGEGYAISIGPGGCLYVYTKEQWASLKQKFSNINPFRENELRNARYLLKNSWEAEEDNQGRILLPENLRKYAKIDKNIVVFQGPVYVEIWAQEVDEEYFADMSFETLANAIEKTDNDGRV